MNYSDIRKKHGIGLSEEEETKKSGSTYFDIQKKHGISYDDVDEEYINKFISDYNTLAQGYQSDYDSKSYGNASTLSSRYSSSASDLRYRASRISQYLKLHKDSIDEESYNSLAKTIESIESSSRDIESSFTSYADLVSKYKTEVDYNKAVEEAKQYQAEQLKYSTWDLGDLERTIKDLESLYSEVEGYDKKAKEGKPYDNRTKLVLRDSTLQKRGYKSLEELRSHIDTLQESYDKAYVVQNTNRVNPNSEYYDPESAQWLEKAKDIKNPSVGDATGVYAFGLRFGDEEVQNPVTYTRENYDKYTKENQTMNGGSLQAAKLNDLYMQMTDDEANAYSALLAQDKVDGGNRSERYLTAINETLEKRKAGEESKPFTDAPALGLVFNTAYRFGSFFEDAVKMVTNAEGEKSDPSVADYKAQIIASENADAWGAPPEWMGLGDSWYNVASDVTGTIGYMLPSILAAKLTGGASLALGASSATASTAAAVVGSGSMGMASAGSGYQEMIDLGYSKEQARTYGIMIGAAEGLTSYALSGISDVGGKLTGNFIKKAADKIDNAIGRFAVNLGGHIGSEILEEEVQLWLEPAIKDMVLGIDFEAPTADDMLYTALVTAFSTFLLESPNTAATEIKNYKDGKNIKSQGAAEVDRLVSLGKTFSADTVAAQIAGKVNKDTGAYTIGRLFNEMGASLSSQNVSDITKVLVEKGFTPEQAKKHVDTLLQVTNRMSSGKELTKRQQVALESNSVLAQVLNDVLINPNSTVNQRNMAYRHYSELSKSKSEANVSDTAEIYSDPETVKAIVGEGIAAPEGTQSKVLATEYNKILENGGTLSTEQVEKLVSANQEVYPAEETPVKYGVDKFGKVQVSLDTEGETTDVKTFDKTTGEEVAFKEFSEISKDGKVAKLRLEDGSEISAKDLSIGNRSDALIVEGLLNMTVDNAHIDADTANALLKEARNGIHPSTIQSDVRIRLYGIKEALTYGYYGYDSKQLMSDNGMAAEISDSLRSTAYILGRDLGKERRASNQAKITDAIEDRKQSGVEKAEAEGKLRFSEGEKKALAGISSDQKAVVDFFRDIAVATPSGMKLIGYDVNANGYTNLTTGEMFFSLSSDASHNPVAAALFTAGHESGHYIKLYNPEGFRRLGEFLAKEYGKKGESVNAIVREKMATSKQNLTYDQAHEEWVCQSLQRMFASVINNKDSGVLQRLQQYDNKVAQLLYKALSKLASKISSLLEKITPKTKEEAFVAEMDATVRKLFEAMYAEELVTAIDNAQWLSGVDVMTEILGNKSIEVGKTSLQEMNRRQTRFQERTEFEAQPKEIISVGTDAKKPKANRKTLGGRNKVTIAGKTFKGDVSVKELRDARFKENGFSQKKIDKHNEFIQHMADMMKEARVKYRFIGLDDIYNAKILISPTSGEITLSALVNNGDYPINFDFTKICKKRVALQQIVDQLARQKGKVNADGSVTEVNLSPENIKAINDILAEAGIETACLCCFVESKRFNIQSLVQENVIDVWNSLVDEFDSDAEYFNFADESVNDSKIPDKEFDALYEQVVAWRKQKGKSDIPKEKMQQFLETTPAARKKLRFSDLVTEKGRTNLHKLYPDIESLIGSTLGTAAPKSVEAFAPYNGEIDLMESTSETGMREYLFSIAGARSQSFSDFMIAHIFDVVQKTASLSARKFPAHVYTKEIARARLFGMTGEKHNMSVLFNIDPEVDSWNAGLKKDGSYFLSDYKAYKSGESKYIQSIGWDEAVNLQNTEGYSKDCGIIAVGFSYNNMIKIHNDPDVRQVIGYHTSSLPAVVKPLTNLDKATDYTPVQNTLEFVGFVKPMYAIPEGVPSYATPPQDVQPIKGKAKTKQVDNTFDIKATFNKLAKGKKGEARTQAAKETLRQFLEYAESNGLALKTKKAEGGHGDFDLYSDVAKTKNPYKSADHYIEYCIERGYLPAFFEFSMNPNYYKDIFDFNVFDRLSYNPETGLHEDSDGRQAYAPQTAVHMLNEDGSYAFPSDFFEIVDKQMKNYDEYSQMVEEKKPSVMKEIASIDGMGSNLKLQERDSEGNQLSEGQKEFFKDSKVRDKDGNLMVVYHGTANGGAFTVFDGDKLSNDTRTTQAGQGFYFTNTKNEAEAYTKNVDIYGKVSRGSNPHLHQVYLNITKPFVVGVDSLDIDKAKSVYMDGTYEYFFDSWIPFYLNNKTVNGRLFTKSDVQAMDKAEKVSVYVDYLSQLGVKEVLSNMVRAFPNGKQSELLASMKKQLGYDGIIEEFKQGQYQYVAFSSEQIKLTTNTNPTSDPDIRYQFRTETDSQKISEAEKLEKEGATRKDIWDRYGIIRDAGGHWVSEFSDKYARIYPRTDATGEIATGTIRLKNIFKHPELYARFPEAAEIKIDLDLPESSKASASYNRKTNTISLNERYLRGGNKYTLKRDLLHEIQHFIQNQDGRPRGASPAYYQSLGLSEEEAFEAYIYTAGEIEARMTTDRMDYDDSRRESEMPDYQWGKAKVRYQEREVSTITETEYKELEKHFGTTGNFRVAGYLLTNGKLLDFSGKHWGDTTSRTRQVDHRDVSEVLNRGNNGIDDMVDMIGNGNIRLMPEVGGINLAIYPNEKQRRVLSVYINYMLNTEGGVVIDYDSVGGDTVYSREYGKTATSRQILSDIRNYFNGARQSDLMQFHTMYQERSTEDISNRGLLANALESAATDGEEKNLLRNYKTNIRLIEAEQKKLSEIKDKLFAKGSKIDPEERKKLQFEMKQTSSRINSYDRQLLKLEAMQPIKKVLAREKEMAKKRQKQKDMQLLAEYKEKSKATVRELLERNQESRQKAIEGREKTFMRNKIKGVVNDLNQLLLKGTKDKHVMIGLQKAVASALDAVNMDTVGADERIAKYDALIAKAKDPDVIASLTATRDRIAEQGDKMSEKLAALKSSYADIKNSKDPLIANSHDEVIENKIESVVNSVGNTPLRDMTLEQLEDVYDLYKMVLTTIRNSNKAFKMDKTKTIAILGNNIMGEIDSIAGEKKYVPVALEGLKKFGWSSLKPTQAFETIGSGTFKNLFANVRAGEDVWAVDVNEAREYYREKTSKYGYDSWDFKQRYEFTSKSGKKFWLSLEQIMSIYAYSKRKQADLHLEQGGFVFDEAIEVVEKKKGIPIKYKVNTATAYSISKEELGNIIGTLSDRQRFFVDEMQTYLSDVMGAKGNEVSLEMYGVKLFKEQFYFPLKSAKQFMFEQNEVAGEVKIKNSGFSKETVAKANNPIILSNFVDVWANHVNDMSMYHAFVLPLEDFNRVFNYKTPTSDKYNPESVKSYLQNAYGTQPVQYIKQLITDLNGGARSDASAGFVNKGISLFKKGAVFASASVVIQQPSAIARAFAYINPIYFATAKVDLTKHSRDWEECKQYAPVATIKEMGYFDTNVGPQTTEWITAKEYKGFGEKIKAVFTDSNYRDEILSKAPALADELAWTHIWNAVKKEIASTTNLKVGTEEFLKRAGERFTEVIVNTQVYDSVLSRSGLMRSKDTGVKMATAFMAEPTTSLNMMVNAVVQSKRGNKKFARNIVGGVVSSIILNSILVSLVYAGRDDDEDETYAEKYLGSLTSELLDGFNPITYIPFAKDVWSIAQGYNVERSDMSTYSKLWQSFEELFDENKSALDKVIDFSGSVANLFGLPVKNITRDIMAVYNTVANDLGISDTTMAGVGDSAADALRNSVPLLGRFYKEDTKAQKLYDAILGGNDTEISRAKSQFKDQKAIDNAIRKALRENDPRIKEAAQARIDGDMTLYKKLALEIKAEGYFSQDNIVGAINSEINELTKTESSGTSKSVPMYTTADYYKAAANGDYADVEAVKEYLIQSGKTESQIESSLNTYVKDAYEKGEIGESKAVSLMVSFGGKDDDEANIAIKYVDFKAEYPEYEDIITESKYAKYYEPMSDYHNRSIESSGISISVYAKYCELSAECEGTDKDGDGKTDSGSKKAEILRVIHKLPINSYQKDALYYLNGWSEKTIGEAPWH